MLDCIELFHSFKFVSVSCHFSRLLTLEIVVQRADVPSIIDFENHWK